MRMRTVSALAGLAFLLTTVPATAGTLTFSGGQGTWKSTKCIEPSAPQSLLNANSETPASDMNTLMTQYNEYAGAMQAYMNCISGEAQNDAETANKTISQSAQTEIQAAGQKVSSFSSALGKKK